MERAHPFLVADALGDGYEVLTVAATGLHEKYNKPRLCGFFHYVPLVLG